MRSKSLKQRGVYEPGPTAASGESRETKPRSRAGRRLFVLDTNVLMHDPTAIFRFEEHDVYLPMVVLEEKIAVDRKSTRLNSSHLGISYAVFCLKKKKKNIHSMNLREICSIIYVPIQI